MDLTKRKDEREIKNRIKFIIDRRNRGYRGKEKIKEKN